MEDDTSIEFWAMAGGRRQPSPVDLHVGNRVRLRRMLLGMSQARLAERLNVTFQQVQKYEKGVNRIGASRLLDLARVLGVSVVYFYEEVPEASDKGCEQGAGPDGMRADDELTSFICSPEGYDLMIHFFKIEHAAIRRSVIDLVKGLSKVNAGK